MRPEAYRCRQGPELKDGYGTPDCDEDRCKRATKLTGKVEYTSVLASQDLFETSSIWQMIATTRIMLEDIHLPKRPFNDAAA